MQARKDAKTMHQDDSTMIERCKQGDLSAFDALVRQYEKQVYNFAYRMTGNYDDASDIATNTFVKVFNAIETYRGDASFTTWLFRIVTNLYLDERKRSKAHLNIPLDEYIDLEESSVIRQVEDATPSPAEKLESVERCEALDQAVRCLPDYQRIMILLYHTQELSYEEIAQIVGLPIGTVKSRLNRARISLKEKLEPFRELFDV